MFKFCLFSNFSIEAGQMWNAKAEKNVWIIWEIVNIITTLRDSDYFPNYSDRNVLHSWATLYDIHIKQTVSIWIQCKVLHIL